jgi:uncharacterized protein YqeY
MDSSLKLKIQEDMKSAMRAKEVLRLGTIRMLLAAMKQKEVDERVELTDSDILKIVEKLIKQRRDAAEQFRVAERLELAEKEEQEIGMLSVYLPAQLSDAELETMVDEAIKQVGATLMKEMGGVMSVLRPQVQGRADMSVVSDKIKKKLQ